MLRCASFSAIADDRTVPLPPGTTFVQLAPKMLNFDKSFMHDALSIRAEHRGRALADAIGGFAPKE